MSLFKVEDLQEENKQLKAAVIQKEEELIGKKNFPSFQQYLCMHVAAKKELASFKELAESRNQEIKELKQEHENLWKAKGIFESKGYSNIISIIPVLCKIGCRESANFILLRSCLPCQYYIFL